MVVDNFERTLSVERSHRMRLQARQLHLVEETVHDPAISTIHADAHFEPEILSSTSDWLGPNGNGCRDGTGASVNIHPVHAQMAWVGCIRRGGRRRAQQYERLRQALGRLRRC